MEIEKLVHIPLFSALSDRTLQAVALRSFERTLPAGQVLFIEGEQAESCYFILEGVVRVYRMNTAGRMQILARLSTGAPVNVVSLLTEARKNRANVESLTDVKAAVLRSADFEWLMAHCPDFSTALLRTFARRIARMTDLAAGLSLNSVRVRLASFLIDLAGSPQTAGGWTQDEIAAEIGTVRDVVGRLLRDFENRDLIRRDRQQIILLDREGLYREAERSSDEISDANKPALM